MGTGIRLCLPFPFLQLNTTNEAMSNDQQNPSEQPQDAAALQTMRDILREEIENPWGLPPLPSEPTKDAPGV